jgi:hypothetical protein
MASGYSIYRWNGALLKVVTDGTVDTSYDLKLIGKSYAGYGQAQNENFIHLLENFSNTVQPPSPLSGQIWFDSGNKKLKFFDGSKFRNAGGAEVSTSAPTGLSTGDFWFDTSSKQLKAWDGTTFQLIGPQAVTGSATTQMQSVSVRDASGTTHAIIEAIANGTVIFTISSDADFTLDNTANAIPGFTKIRQGITLCYTNNDAQEGQTTSSHRFYGTSTNSDRLGGLTASNYIRSSNASFSTLVNFSDTGFTVGNPTAKLAVFNDGADIPTLQSMVNSKPIVFQTKLSDSSTAYPMKLLGNDVLPGSVTATNNLGSLSLQWKNVYAGYYYGTAQQTDALLVGAQYVQANTVLPSITNKTSLVARDSNGDFTARNITATVSQADTLKYGASYISTSVTSTPSTILVRDASANIAVNYMSGTAQQANALQVGASYLTASTTAINTIVARDASGNFTANVITASLTGNVTGIAQKASQLQLDGNLYVSAVTNSLANTIVARDASQNITAASVTIGSVAKSGTNGVGDIGQTGNRFGVIYGTSTSAYYADLAEKYLADAEYEVGTVMMIGGEKEVTASSWGKRAIGAVSANPAFKMNDALEGGTYIALKGRIPVKVVGRVKKGDELVASDNGCAVVGVPHSSGVFAVALEASDDSGVKLVECLVL